MTSNIALDKDQYFDCSVNTQERRETKKHAQSQTPSSAIMIRNSGQYHSRNGQVEQAGVTNDTFFIPNIFITECKIIFYCTDDSQRRKSDHSNSRSVTMPDLVMICVLVEVVSKLKAGFGRQIIISHLARACCCRAYRTDRNRTQISIFYIPWLRRKRAFYENELLARC